MNVFELIKEKLEEIKDQKTRLIQLTDRDFFRYSYELRFLEEIKEIVNQLAEEYNNGWIACSERLPDEATTYQVTEEVVVNSKKQYIVDIRLFGTEGEWLCPSNRKIIAWQPLPTPYEEGGTE